jgi:hypothetical protein
MVLMVFPTEKTLSGSEYHSRCLAPDFSADENSIAYFDQTYNDVLQSSWTNSLQIYNIPNKTNTGILTRVFKQTRIVWCAEIIDEFQQVKWSPDGQYLAFSLDGEFVEIYSLKEKKTISRLTFKKNHRDMFMGYYYLEWLGNDSLITGYISKYAGLADTHDTYGLIKKQGTEFEIKQGVIPKNAPLLSTLNPSNGDQSKDARGFPMLIIGKGEEVQKIFFNKEEIEYSWEMLYLARPGSSERLVLSVSNSGRYAIVVENTGIKSDEMGKHKKVNVSLIEIPGPFKKYLKESK